MKTHQKFNPNNIQNIDSCLENNDLESLSFEEQVKLSYKDTLIYRNQFNSRAEVNKKSLNKKYQELDHKNKNMTMKQQWSLLLSAYLIFFTFAMFVTLWLNKTFFDLDKITLNFLITVGFAKVVGVVWLIVSHLFPSKEDLVKTKKSFAN